MVVIDKSAEKSSLIESRRSSVLKMLSPIVGSPQTRWLLPFPVTVEEITLEYPLDAYFDAGRKFCLCPHHRFTLTAIYYYFFFFFLYLFIFCYSFFTEPASFISRFFLSFYVSHSAGKSSQRRRIYIKWRMIKLKIYISEMVSSFYT